MRKLPVLLTAIVAASLIVTPPASATTTPRCSDDPFLQNCWLPGPRDWTWLHLWEFHSCESCKRAGDAGIARGDWAEYRCGWFPAGLDITYYIYIPPVPELASTP
jgi:hypothetical protein